MQRVGCEPKGSVLAAAGWSARSLTAAMVLALAASQAARAAAFTLTGVVANELGQGIANVDLDFIDTCTGDNVFLVNDKTVASGAFSVVVNEGTYDLRFTPPAGSTVAGAEIRAYTVAANASLGTTTLVAGRLVSGTVRNTSNAGIAGVDLKFVDVATGSKIWVGKDVTSSTGTYAVRVRPGTFDIEYRPPATTTFLTKRRSGLLVGASDISGLVDVLPTGFKADGAVKDPNGIVVKNADLDVFDDCTGEKVPTANDNTDVQGKYAIFLPAGTFSVHVNPPACKGLASERIPDVSVSNNVGIGNTTLLQGFPVSGRVLDELGAPLANAKLKFYDAVTGRRQGATGDDTDAAGNFRILIPSGTFNINIEPPSSRDLMVQRLAGVVVAGATSLGDNPLAPGPPVAGLVVGPGGPPVQNVNINMVDSLTRASAQLAHDSSGADGSFRVIVPPGTYDIQYKAPVCTGLAPDDQKSVTIAGPTALPLMALVTGAHATGLVVDDATPHANPVAGADLDFFPAGSVLKSYTPGDTTKASGDYDVLVKPGIYDIDYRPPAGSRLRPVRTSSVGVPGNVTLPTVALRSGLVLSGTVHATSTGLPVAGVRVDVFPAAGGIASWTPHNDTAVDGSFLFSVDAGTWDLQFVPPAGSGLAPRWRRGVAVGADLALGDTLLLPLTVPSVLDATPNIGSTTGGQTVTIAGSGFQPDATVLIGGVPAAGVTFVSPAAITAVTGHHPPGPVDVAVANPGAQIGARPSAYTYVEPASPVVIRLSKSGADVVLNWQANGQGTYTIFRGASATGFTSASIRGTTAGTSFTDIGGAAAGTIQFYNVD